MTQESVLVRIPANGHTRLSPYAFLADMVSGEWKARALLGVRHYSIVARVGDSRGAATLSRNLAGAVVFTAATRAADGSVVAEARVAGRQNRRGSLAVTPDGKWEMESFRELPDGAVSTTSVGQLDNDGPVRLQRTRVDDEGAVLWTAVAETRDVATDVGADESGRVTEGVVTFASGETARFTTTSSEDDGGQQMQSDWAMDDDEDKWARTSSVTVMTKDGWVKTTTDDITGEQTVTEHHQSTDPETGTTVSTEWDTATGEGTQTTETRDGEGTTVTGTVSPDGVFTPTPSDDEPDLVPDPDEPKPDNGDNKDGQHEGDNKDGEHDGDPKDGEHEGPPPGDETSASDDGDGDLGGDTGDHPGLGWDGGIDTLKRRGARRGSPGPDGSDSDLDTLGSSPISGLLGKAFDAVAGDDDNFDNAAGLGEDTGPSVPRIVLTGADVVPFDPEWGDWTNPAAHAMLASTLVAEFMLHEKGELRSITRLAAGIASMGSALT